MLVFTFSKLDYPDSTFPKGFSRTEVMFTGLP